MKSLSYSLEKVYTLMGLLFFLTSFSVLASSPQISGLSPANNSSNTGLNGPFSITFDQNIELGLSNKQLNVIDVFTEEILTSYALTSSSISISGNTLTFSPPPGALEYNQEYYLNLQSGAVKNDSEEYFSGMAYADWEISTGPDNDAPTEVTKLPAHMATDILEGTDGILLSVLYLVFNEPIQAGTGTVVIRRSSDDVAAVSMDMTNSSSWFIPSSQPEVINFRTDVALDPSTEYYIDMPSGAVTDLLGNPFPGFAAGEWSYTTRDFVDDTAPLITSLIPATEASNVELENDLILTFNENIEAGTGNILLKAFSTDQTVQTIDIASTEISANQVIVDLPMSLDASTEYYVEVASGVILDAAGNAFAGISKPQWRFTSGDGADIVAPQSVSLSPAHESFQVWTYQDLQIDFNEPIQKGVGIIYVKDFTTDVVVHAINVASSEVSTDILQRLDVDLPPGLQQNSEYYVEMVAGVVQDLSGNDFPGFSKGEWVFETTDTTLPEMVSVSPADGSVDVALDATFTMELSEFVIKHSSGSIRIRRTSDNASVHTYFVQSATVTINDNLVSFDLPGAGVLEEGVEYFIDISYGSGNGLKDKADNFFEGLDDSDWNFRTFSTDDVAPTIASLAPVDEAIGVETDALLQITFDEDIKKTTGPSGSISIYRASDDQLVRTINILSSEVTISDNTLTIQPNVLFQANTEYYVQMGGIVSDLVDNVFAGISATDWSFTTFDPGDVIAPQATVRFPQTATVPVGTDVVIYFDEPVELADGGYIRFRRVSDNWTLLTINATSEELEVVGNSLTVNLSSDLPPSTEIYVEMQGLIQDLSGNYFAGYGFEDHTWSFTTDLDVTPPGLLSTDPALDAGDVGLDGIFTMTFDERVFKAAGIPLFKTIGDEFVDVLIGSEIIVSDNIVTIDPGFSLDPGTSYYLKISATSFRDQYDNFYPGLPEERWFFRTAGAGDIVSPEIQTLTPLNGASNVSGSTQLSIEFNEDIARGMGALSLKEADTDNLIALIDIEEAVVTGGSATFMIPALQENGTGYYVELENGAITDLEGNAFSGISGSSVWAFSTTDNQKPFLINTTPSDGAMEIVNSGAQFSLQFSESISEGTGSIFIKSYEDGTNAETFTIGTTSNYTVVGNTLTLMPQNTLNPNQRYYIWMSATAVEDLSGNTFNGITDQDVYDFFTFGEDIPPMVTGLSPLDDATAVDVSSDLVITFDEDVTFSGSGFAQVKFATGGTRETIDLSSSNATFSGNVLTLNLANDLLYTNDYYVVITEDAIEDLSGNGFAGFTSSSDWNFTTEGVPDLNPPVATNLSPFNGQTYVAVDADLLMYFNENIQKGSGNILIREMVSDAIVETIDVADASVTVSGNSITMNPVSDLGNITEYYIEIGSGVIEDLASNPFGGIAKPDWSFTTRVLTDVTPPSVVSFDPADGAMNLNIDTDLTITFDEPVQNFGGFIQIFDSDDNLVQNLNTNLYVTVDENSITIDPPNNLEYNKSYYLTNSVGVITDLSNNSFTMSKGDYSFSTAATDVHGPTIIDVQPDDGETEVELANLNLFMFFDENVQHAGGNVYVKRASDDVAVITRAASALIGSGTLRFIATGGALQKGTEYYVEIENTGFEDTNGNAYGGLAKGNWHFTTESDLEEPMVQSLVPVNGASSVNVDQNLTITFDEDIAVAGGVIFLKNAANEAIIDSYDVNDAEITIGTNSIVIDPAQDLSYETEYIVEIGSGIVEDQHGNLFAGTFDGDWNFTTVDQLTQTITFPAIPDKTFGDSDFTLNATSNSGLPETYEIVDGPALLDGDVISITGTGTVTVKATQSGNDVYAASTPVERSFSVAKSDQTISFASITDRPFGDPSFIIQPTATSGLDVTLSITGPAFLNENEVVSTGVGTITISANQGGDENFNPAVEVQQSFEVLALDQTISFAPLADKTYGDPSFPLSATATSGLAITYSVQSGNAVINGSDLSIMGAGDVTVRSAQTGNENFNAAIAVDQTFTVNKASLQVEAEDRTITYGEAIPTLTFDYTGFVNGDDATALTTAPVAGTMATGSSDAGTYPISVSGGVADDYAFNYVDGLLTIEKADQTISVTAIADKDVSSAAFAVSASTSSGLSLDYSITSGPATILGQTITLTGSTGTVVVEVAQTGNVNYNSASSSISFNVNDASLLDQEITFSTLSDVTYGVGDFDLSASSDSGLPVSFTLISGPATVSGSTVSVTGVGTVVIEAQQVGDVAYNPAAPVRQSFEVEKALLTVTADDLDKTYGDVNPTLTISYSGFVLGEDMTVLASVPMASTIADVASGTGTYAISTSGGAAGNYEMSYVAGTLTVLPAPLNASVGDYARTYGDTNPAFEISYSGFVNGEDISDISVLPGATTTAQTTSVAGTYSIELSGGSADNYTFTYTDGTLTVNQATLSVTADDQSKTYGDANPGLTVSYSGFRNGEDETSLTTAPVANTTADETSAVGMYAITSSGGVDDNYTFAYSDGTLTVNQATLSVTADDQSKTYGDANPGMTVSYSGFQNGEDETSLTTAPVVNTTADETSAVGTYAITASGGVDDNYTFAYIDGTLTVNQATLSVTTDDQTKTYGAANPTLTFTYSGFLNGEDETVLDLAPTASTTATTTSDAGAYSITASGGEDTNYEFTYNDGTLTINKTDQTITFDALEDKTVGDADFDLTATTSSGLTISYTSSDETVATVTGSTVTILNTGTTTITASQIGGTNFNAATDVTQTLTVNANIQDQTITFEALANRTYGTSPYELTGTASSGLALSYTSSDATVATVSDNTVTVHGVGTTTITASQAGNDSYTAAPDVSQTLIVDLATLTVTADDQSKVYGEANPTLTLTYSGFQNGEDATSLTTEPTVSTTTDETSPTGTYAITASGGVAGNYTFAYTDGTLTVNQATLSVAADDQSKTYGTANPALNVTYSGYRNGEDETSLTTAPAANTTADEISTVGTYAITASGGVDDNYTFAYTDGTLTVNQATLSVTADDQTITYGDAIPSLTVTYSGFQNGEDETVLDTAPTASTAATTTSDAGAYSIIVSGGADHNYALNYTDGTLTINKADQTITFDALADKTVGDAAFDLTATASSGLAITYKSSDETVAMISGRTVTILASGTTTITASQAGGTNFNAAADMTQTLMVHTNVQDQTITFEALTNQTYGASPYELAAVASSGLAVSYTSSDESVAMVSGNTVTVHGVGMTTITASQAGNDSYTTATDVAQMLKIDPATLTVTADDQTKVYGEANPTLTVTYVGFVNGEDATILDTKPTISTTATSTSSVGTYQIEVAGGSSSNYEITPVAGTMTITKATLVATADDQVMRTGEAVPNLTISYSGFVNGDTETDIDIAPTISTDATSASPSGLYDILLTGGEDNNYDLTLINGTLTIETVLGLVLEQSQIMIYPNPVVDRLHIDFPRSLSGEEITVQLFDLEGRELQSKDVKGYGVELDVRDVPTGILLLQMSAKGEVIRKRVRKD